MIMSLSFSSSKFDLFSELWHTREYGQQEDKDILTIFGPYLDHLFSSDFSSVSQSDSHGPVKDIPTFKDKYFRLELSTLRTFLYLIFEP